MSMWYFYVEILGVCPNFRGVSKLRQPFDDPIGANESARQAGSYDTGPDPRLEISCFTVRKLQTKC